MRVISYKRLCDFSHYSKTGNYVITWRGVKNINRKPQLVGGGGNFGPIYQKSAFETVQVLQSILAIQFGFIIWINGGNVSQLREHCVMVDVRCK